MKFKIPKEILIPTKTLIQTIQVPIAMQVKQE